MGYCYSFNTHLIKNEKDYEKALKRVDELMDANPPLNTPLSDELECLVLRIERYEDELYGFNGCGENTVKRVNNDC